MSDTPAERVADGSLNGYLQQCATPAEPGQNDLFHASVPAWWIARVLATAAACPRHVFLVLTKRHGRMRSLLTSPAFRDLYEAEYAALLPALTAKNRGQAPGTAPWPVPGLHLGTSAENHEQAELRIPALLACRQAAGVLWVSAEPLLGDMNLTRLRVRGNLVIDALRGDVTGPREGAAYTAAPGSLDWIVAGGESGRLDAARPASPDWFRGLRDQAAACGTAFWVKQAGVHLARQWGMTKAGAVLAELPAEFRIRQLPRTAAVTS
jgi:protein gp37